MKNRLYILPLVLMAALSCQRMPLYDLELQPVELVLNLQLDLDLQLDVDLNLDVAVSSTIEMPEVNKVLFYSVDDDNLQYTEFVDSTGGSINTPAGHYQMLIYNFGTEYIQVRGENNIKTIEAFTSDITPSKGNTLRGFSRADGEEEPQGPIIYAPDHLLVTYQDITIPELTDADQSITIQAAVRTIVNTYAFEVHSVIGAEYIESCEAFVTNQSRSCFFGTGQISQEPATICFPVGVDRQKGCLYTTFNTFGKLPGESRSYLHIIIRDTDGQEYRFSADITDQFVKPDSHIVIDEPVDIPEPPSHSGGGIAPSVDPWDNENHDVPIG